MLVLDSAKIGKATWGPSTTAFGPCVRAQARTIMQGEKVKGDSKQRGIPKIEDSPGAWSQMFSSSAYRCPVYYYTYKTDRISIWKEKSNCCARNSRPRIIPRSLVVLEIVEEAQDTQD